MELLLGGDPDRQHSHWTWRKKTQTTNTMAEHTNTAEANLIENCVTVDNNKQRQRLNLHSLHAPPPKGPSAEKWNQRSNKKLLITCPTKNSPYPQPNHTGSRDSPRRDSLLPFVPSHSERTTTCSEDNWDTD